MSKIDARDGWISGPFDDALVQAAVTANPGSEIYLSSDVLWEFDNEVVVSDNFTSISGDKNKTRLICYDTGGFIFQPSDPLDPLLRLDGSTLSDILFDYDAAAIDPDHYAVQFVRTWLSDLSRVIVRGFHKPVRLARANAYKISQFWHGLPLDLPTCANSASFTLDGAPNQDGSYARTIAGSITDFYLAAGNSSDDDNICEHLFHIEGCDGFVAANAYIAGSRKSAFHFQGKNGLGRSGQIALLGIYHDGLHRCERGLFCENGDATDVGGGKVVIGDGCMFANYANSEGTSAAVHVTKKLDVTITKGAVLSNADYGAYYDAEGGEFLYDAEIQNARVRGIYLGDYDYAEIGTEIDGTNAVGSVGVELLRPTNNLRWRSPNIVNFPTKVLRPNAPATLEIGGVGGWHVDTVTPYFSTSQGDAVWVKTGNGARWRWRRTTDGVIIAYLSITGKFNYTVAPSGDLIIPAPFAAGINTTDAGSCSPHNQPYPAGYAQVAFSVKADNTAIVILSGNGKARRTLGASEITSGQAIDIRGTVMCEIEQ